MNETPLRIAYLTAGAAGMYCGSCMHDNTLAAALTRLGVDIQLIPTYTPIRTDEADVSADRVFFGGVNVYLQQRFPLFRYLPAFLDGLLSHPRLLRWAASRGVALSPEQLGALTVSMLQGEDGRQRKEVRRLSRWLAGAQKPDIVVLTNMLIGGCIPRIKRALGCSIVVTLQGDDVFLEFLPEPFRSRAIGEIRRLGASVDGFLVHSRFYADFMADYFSVSPEKLYVVPLGIDTRDFSSGPAPAGSAEFVESSPPTIGYMARLAPEKGLHVLVDAFLRLRSLPGTENAQLRVAGWLGPDHRKYAESQFNRLRAAGLGDAFSYAGVLDRAGKVAFLRGLDVLSVPTVYREPKGLYVLEALAAGVPVVQPAHGAFPELLAATAGGCLVPPNDPAALATKLNALLTERQQLCQFGKAGRHFVHRHLNAESAATATLAVLRPICLNARQSPQPLGHSVSDGRT